MTNQDSAYRMWINGKLSAENGIVAVNADDYRPQRLPKCIFHFAESPEIEVVMQIANYSHKWGGLTNNIYFGLPSQILRYITDSTASQFLSAVQFLYLPCIICFYS